MKHCRNNSGFTLVEMMVIIVIIAIVAAVAMPVLTTVMTSGQDTQAYNLLAAQLLAARAVALQWNTYAGVHLGMSDAEDQTSKCYAVIVWDDPATGNHNFTGHPGYTPMPLPGAMAAGKIDSTTTTAGGDYKASELGDASAIRDFAEFTVMFTPEGKATVGARGEKITISDSDLFGNDDRNIWSNAPPAHEAVTALTLFDYAMLTSMSNGEARKDYLDESGMILPVNVHTGLLMGREGD